ncbi:hypothetical protein ACWD69_08445 [Micromonospora chokoriensis]
MELPFVVTLRGYDMHEVESLFAEVDGALATDSPVLRAAARDALRAASLRRRPACDGGYVATTSGPWMRR